MNQFNAKTVDDPEQRGLRQKLNRPGLMGLK